MCVCERETDRGRGTRACLSTAHLTCLEGVNLKKDGRERQRVCVLHVRVFGVHVWERDDVLVCVCGCLSMAGISDTILLLESIVLWGSQCVAIHLVECCIVFCSVLTTQRDLFFGRVLQCVAVFCVFVVGIVGTLSEKPLFCSVLQCVAVCCRVLPCVAVLQCIVHIL